MDKSSAVVVSVQNLGLNENRLPCAMPGTNSTIVINDSDGWRLNSWKQTMFSLDRLF